MTADTTGSIRRNQLMGALLALLLVLVLGGWAVRTDISGAVTAPATVVVESGSKAVQHPEGGLIEEILVKDGQQVSRGELLVRLEGTELEAGLAIVRSRLNDLMARHARLIAERDGARAVTFPEALESRKRDAAVAQAMRGQVKLFESRRDSLAGKKEQLHQRIQQHREEIKGLEAQKKSNRRQDELIGRELAGLQLLRAKDLVTTGRLLALERASAKLEGEYGKLVTEIARVKGRVDEIRLNVIQIDQTERTEVLTELNDVETQVEELMERKVASELRLKRCEIRAPDTGIVHRLAVNTIGGVIKAGEPILLIVPAEDSLVLEAKVSPASIDQVRPEQEVIIRFAAFDKRKTPELSGIVASVAADSVSPRPGMPPFYPVTIKFAPDEFADLGNVSLKPGMFADVFIQSGERSVISYLLKPMADQMARIWKER